MVRDNAEGCARAWEKDDAGSENFWFVCLVDRWMDEWWVDWCR